MSKESQYKASKKYDANMTTGLYLKLNNKTDADIISKLSEVPNKQGYVKQAIRNEIERGNDMELHGIWIEDANETDARFGRHEYRCSNCGHYATEHIGGTENWWCISKPNFCPNCGVKMDAEKILADERQQIINKIADKPF